MPRVRRVPIVMSSLGRGTGSGRSSSASARLNIATFAPVPKAIEMTAMAVKPGFLAKTRAPWRTSRDRPAPHARPGTRIIVDGLGNVEDCRWSRYDVCQAVMPKPSDLLQGTLDLLILKTVARDALHGWAISKRIQELSGEVLSVQQGSLYPALHRLEHQGWITADWKATDLGRTAKFYTLTREGRQQLERELESWNRLSSAVRLVIKRA
jgi:PadR family transcriptional regulator, regulatory protein PadR